MTVSLRLNIIKHGIRNVTRTTPHDIRQKLRTVINSTPRSYVLRDRSIEVYNTVIGLLDERIPSMGDATEMNPAAFLG